MKLKTFFLCLIATCYLLPATKVRAASFDLSVSPSIFQIELTPPAVANAAQTITLENNSEDALPLEIQYKPFRASGNNGQIEYLKEDERIGNDPLIFQKISLLQDGKRVESITLPPKTKRQYDLAISVPKDEPPGDYYFSLVFATDTKAGTESAVLVQEQGSVSHSLGGIAMHVLLSIGPKTKTTGSIEEFSTSLFKAEGPVPFTVKLKNTSSHFIYPKAQILITNIFGQTIGKVELLPVNILANSSRSLPSTEQFALIATESDKKTATKKPSKVIQELLATTDNPIAIWPETFLLGPYTATLTVAFSDEGPLYTQSLLFIGLPVYVLTGFVIAILLVLAIRSRLKHRTKIRQ